MPINQSQIDELDATRGKAWSALEVVAGVIVPAMVSLKTQIDALVADDGSGGDTTPPQLTIETTPRTDGVTLDMTTNEPAWFVVEIEIPFDGRWQLLETTSSTNLRTSHRNDVRGLVVDTDYRFQIKATDATGNKVLKIVTARTLAAGFDTTPPIIAAINVVADAVSATVTCRVNERSTVELTIGDKGKQTVPDVIGEVSMQITGLEPETQYVATITATDAASNTATESRTFTTDTADPLQLNESDRITNNFTEIVFDKPVQWQPSVTGQPMFIYNGASIVATSPPSNQGTRVKNGMMASPDVGIVHGFDSHGGISGSRTIMRYDAVQNIAPEASGHPFLPSPGKSIIKAISAEAASARPFITTAGIFTCIKHQLPPRSFRPPYVGGSISTDILRATKDDVDFSKIPSMKLPANTDWTPARAIEATKNIWLDFTPAGESGQYLNPEPGNMQNYGRDIQGELSKAALVMCSDKTSQEDREAIACNIIQIGLDTAAIYMNGGSFWPNGGLSCGRKFPVIFAGLMLGRESIIQLTHENRRWQEDAQTFFISQGQIDAGMDAVKGADTRSPILPFPQISLGLPEWGIRHSTEPNLDNYEWTAIYRQCCTQTTAWGTLAVIEAMAGGRVAWNHEPVFLYAHRYAREQLKREAAGTTQEWYLAYQGRWTFDAWAQIVTFVRP